MRVGVIGSGYVGLVTGTCLAHLNHQVMCVDNNVKKIRMLRRGQCPIYEPGLEKMIRACVKKGRLSFSTRIREAVEKCEIIFICVNTPPRPDGGADLSYVENVSRDIAKNLKSFRLIVEKSTVPVETGDWINRTLRSIQPNEALFEVASNPEFLREGSAVHDFLNPDRIVLGVASHRGEQMLTELYEPLKAKVIVTDLKSAELIKHASNSFLATKISFINAVARVCDAAGADIEKVALGMGFDPRIGPSFLKAGVGFGGSCFPKDLAAFLHLSERVGQRFHLLEEVVRINESQKKYFIQKIESNLWNLKNKTVAVLGIAFKPNTDDIRNAPSMEIIRDLLHQGVQIRAYDPEAARNARKAFKDVFFATSPYQAVRGANALLVLTEWKEFLDLDFKKIKRLLKEPLIFDGRNVLDPVYLKKLGFYYYGIGRLS